VFGRSSSRLARLVPAASAGGSTALASVVALAMLLSADCGGGGDKNNPPPPHVVVQENESIVDVGERFILNAGQSTDPNGKAEDLQFQWRFVSGGTTDTDFEDH